MRPAWSRIALHGVFIGAIAAFLVLLLLYPFLPGAYDSLAMPLSMMVQIFGGVGILVVITAIPWLIYEVWNKRKRKSHYFAIVSMGTSTIVALAVSLAAAAQFGLSLGVLSFTLWIVALMRWARRMTLLKTAETRRFNPAPVYLVLLPLIALAGQILLAAPLTTSSRDHAIANAAELVRDIERHRAEFGSYPESLLAVWPDYLPAVTGIEKYNYAKSGESYNVSFEQPRFFFDIFGTREFVMYNPRDEQLMPSHASWILIWPAERIRTTQGWYASGDTGTPHWKYFRFD
ncbi:hypothetical protein Aph01nite_66830 [Acrocarpospora phusangensis]|uniref:Uncharacterized protein n=1 Tax=Acrocarpospora phusangensis TaxID=1070424 RepID=A0A919QGH6_9ACTN|nr:hypothetical protein [Acrocarpospora phusangensis]GIH28373.1 hypothetical protein Aph01nite_66830 [Acrocarpospora phusangensis]